MKIEETLLTKKIIIETDDPYGLALELMDFVSRFGEVVERENKYETDGPFRKVILNFELIESIDRESHTIVEFFTQGETNHVNYLEIEIAGKFIAEILIDGFFSSSFSEYYIRHIHPRYLKQADEKMKHLEKELTEFASSLKKQKAVKKA